MLQNIQDQFSGFLNTQDIYAENSQGPFSQFQFPEIQLTGKLLADLEKLHHPRNSVLGKRMESFFEIAIRYSERYEMLGSNIQIIERKQTLGEIDFLLYDKMKAKPIHVELVYKLYIYDPHLPLETERWIGPNRRDSFSEKQEKLKSRQFPLLYRPESLIYLDNLNLKPEELEQQLCFKAQLFIPANHERINDHLVNSECYTGKWFKYSDFLAQPWEKNLFHSPAKKDWSARPESGSRWYTHAEIIQTIKTLFRKKKSPLIWMKTSEGYKRFFVVWW